MLWFGLRFGATVCRRRRSVRKENLYGREGDNIFTCVSKSWGVRMTRVIKDYLT